MASSTQEHYHYGTTTAPPPTPNTHDLLESAAAADSLSRLLHRIPPTLSLSFPNRRQSQPLTTTSPPSISLSDPKPTLHSNLLSAAKQHGFFQLTGHSISSHLASSAESESSSVIILPRDKKQQLFPKNWPLGFDDDDDDNDENNVNGDSLCLDSSCSVNESTELDLTCLREFSVRMEKIGLEVIQELACAVGFQNPDPTRMCSLMWISEGSSRSYPFVVGLQYQIRCRKYSMLADSGMVSVSPQVDSLLVTFGDIAQVWSNGKVRKVRGRAGGVGSSSSNDKRSVSMTLLVTLPLDGTVSPLSPTISNDDEEEEDSVQIPVFNSFSFEDYAWRLYHMHQPLLLKDPLLRYRLV